MKGLVDEMRIWNSDGGGGKEGYKLLQTFRLLKHYCPPSLVPHLHSSPPAFPFPPALLNCFGKTNNPKANTANQKKKMNNKQKQHTTDKTE